MAFSPKHCPNSKCSFHQNTDGTFIKKNYYTVKRINQSFRRFQCKHCGRYFSSRSFKADYKHKKMDLNPILLKLLNEGNSLRSCARLLNMTYKNTYNKFLWLTAQAKIKKQALKLKAQELQFDEMETILHTKCKPLSITILVNEKYQILSLEVAQMPAKGRLAAISIRKYGPLPDEREATLRKSFKQLVQKLDQLPSKVLSDAKPSYRKFVEEFFPSAIYRTYSRADKDRHRDRLHEKIHKRAFDPLFQLNQRCALLRSQIRRLTRRSWCTTKKIENLQGHLDLFLVNQSVRNN